MKPVRSSILLRLTLWNASVLALALTLFGGAGWLTIRRAVRARSISSVSESAQAVAAAVHAERLAIISTSAAWPDTDIGDQVIAQELEVGGLDVFITSYPPNSPPESHSSPQEVVLPQPVLKLLAAMHSGEDPEMARKLLSPDSVVVRQVNLAGVPARVAFTVIATDSLHPSSSQGLPRPPALLITAILSEASDWLLLRQVRNALLLAIPVLLLASIVAGYALAKQSLAPLEAINSHTAAITADNLDARLPVVNPHDELGRLTGIINGLLSRVELAFRSQRQFMADASHELRTPIAIIRGEADVTLRRSARSEEEYRDALSVIQGESIRLTQIVDDLFLLARVDAAGKVSTQESIDLQELVIDTTHSIRTIAEKMNVSVLWKVSDSISSSNHGANIRGNSNLLHRLLINLLDNALKHSPAEGVVRVELDQRDGNYIIRVSDDGSGVPEAIREKIFERFVHGTPTNSRASHTGAGLGLAIASAIAHAHGGKIQLLKQLPGSSESQTAEHLTKGHTGAVFEVWLPA